VIGVEKAWARICSVVGHGHALLAAAGAHLAPDGKLKVALAQLSDAMRVLVENGDDLWHPGGKVVLVVGHGFAFR
jgi:hypothetical protein